MRTTLSLDEDVANLLEREIRLSGEPKKVAVNRLLRSGLAQASAPAKPRRFKVKPFKLNLPPEWTSGSVQELIDILESPNAR